MHPSDQSWTLCEHLAAELLASSELHIVPAGPNAHLWVPLSHAGVQSIHALLGSSHAISHLSLVNSDALLSIHTYYAYYSGLWNLIMHYITALNVKHDYITALNVTNGYSHTTALSQPMSNL